MINHDSPIKRTISVAPMMDCTDRHYRYFARLLSRRTVLYSEMVTANAVQYGDQNKLLGFSAAEHPVALQLGGSAPQALAAAAKRGADFGYAEINLNVGCPSDRVQAGRFGACLMKEPNLVAECVDAMCQAVAVPVTIKTRIGVDSHDRYDQLTHFVETIISQADIRTFIIHARKAWLQGLSPRENREIPPLRYDWVYRLKQDFPRLEIILNGGVKTSHDIKEHLSQVDGVMIGREAYANPWLLADVDRLFYGETKDPHSCARSALTAYFPYVAKQLSEGVRLRPLIRPLIGLFQACAGARAWRRHLSTYGHDDASGVAIIQEALKFVDLGITA